MDENILEFSNVLRQNGLCVSPAETLDAFTVVSALGLEDRTAFKAGLRATMVKRTADIPTFDELFEVYFSGVGNAISRATGATIESLSRSQEGLSSLPPGYDTLTASVTIKVSADRDPPSPTTGLK